jgi:hypothetical protein
MPKKPYGVSLTEIERAVLALYRDECGGYDKMLDRHDLGIRKETVCRAIVGHRMDPVSTIEPLRQLYNEVRVADPDIFRRVADLRERERMTQERTRAFWRDRKPRDYTELLMKHAGYTYEQAREAIARDTKSFEEKMAGSLPHHLV